MTEARSVKVVLSAEAAQYIATMQKAGVVGVDAMRKVEKSTMSASQAQDQLGSSAGKAAAGGIALLLATGKSAMDWESQWAGVTKTVDGTTTQMAELEDGLRDLATTLPATHEEIAGVAEAAGQLGVAREDIVGFTKTMIDLGETTNLTAEDAATSIAQISNVLGTTGDDVDNFGATLVALGNDGASTEKQILDMAQRIAGAGAQIGLAESDILAVANAAASMGIEAEAGGSAISRVFTDMAKATAQGGDQLDRFADVAGVSASGFAAAFEADPARAFASFTQGLERINQSGGDVFTTLDQLKLSDIRVSQALLGMAASGDLLTDSLDLGAEAWGENTALALEAAKRYDTTAAQVQVSWNKIKDAGIEAGESLLPIAGGIADRVGAIADALGGLPDPAKSAFTRLLAIGTLTAGGAWLGSKAIGAVNSTREALSSLDTTSSSTSRNLGRVGRAATTAATGLAALAIVDAVQGGMKDTSIGVEAMTRDLLDLDTAAAGELPKNLDGLANSIDRLADPNVAQGLQDNVAGVIGFGGGSELANAQSQLEAIDSALTNLVNTAGPEAAADQLELLAEKADLSEGAVKRLLSQTPNYTEALTKVENEARLAAEAETKVADAANLIGPAMQEATMMTEEQAKALRDAKEEAREAAEEWINLGDSLDDTKVSLSDWLNELEQQQEALRNFETNAKRAADNGLRKGLIAALEDAGPAGALRMKQLANATEEEIARANKAWSGGQEKIRDYIRETTRVPENLTTRVEANTAGAIADLIAFRNRLDEATKDRIFTITTQYKVVRSASDALPDRTPRKAGGGQIIGPGTTTSDSIPILASNKEYVIQAAAVDHYGVGFFDRANAMRLAGGGSTDKKKRKPGFDTNPPPEETEAERQRREAREQQAEARQADIDEMNAQNAAAEADRIQAAQEQADAIFAGQQRAWDTAMDAAKSQVDASKAMVDSVKANMDRLGQAATAGFESPIFTKSPKSGLWTGSGGGASGGWRGNLTGDISGLRERSGIISQLSDPSLGLSAAALEALLGQNDNAGIAAMLAAGEVDDYAALFAEREKLLGEVSGQAGMAGYGSEWTAANAQFTEMNQKLELLTTIIAAARPITVTETISAAAMVAEIARVQAASGGY